MCRRGVCLLFFICCCFVLFLFTMPSKLEREQEKAPSNGDCRVKASSSVDAASKAASEDLAPEAGTGSARSKFPLVLMCRAANRSLLSSAVLCCEICLGRSADCILSASFKGNAKERPVPHLGNQVGRGADGICLSFLSLRSNCLLPKGRGNGGLSSQTCNQTLLVYSAAVSLGSSPASNPACAFSFFPSTCQHVSYSPALLGIARHNSFPFFD